MNGVARCLVLAAVGLAATAHAEPEPERIAAERAAAVARLAERERACQAQFVVTPCVGAARRDERVTLTRLRREELAFDEAQRRAAGARRREAIAERAAAQDARASEAPPAVERASVHRVPTPSVSTGSHAGDLGAPPRAPSPPADQRAAELRNEANFEARARAAQAHRATVERRNAQRAADGKSAAPLPAPSGASAP
jgi:hypothetical protein